MVQEKIQVEKIIVKCDRCGSKIYESPNYPGYFHTHHCRLCKKELCDSCCDKICSDNDWGGDNPTYIHFCKAHGEDIRKLILEAVNTKDKLRSEEYTRHDSVTDKIDEEFHKTLQMIKDKVKE